MKKQSFETFYYTKVGLGEGCGCAERVIDIHEFNRLSGKPRIRAMRKPGLMRRLMARLQRKSSEDLS